MHRAIQRHPKQKHRRARRLLSLAFLGLMASAIAVCAVYLAPYAKEQMDMSLLELPAVNRPATLYVRDPEDRSDRKGDLIPAPDAIIAPTERRIFTPYEEMPDHLIQAFIAIEDKRFYQHHGVDVRRTVAAALGYLTGKSSFGGSTVTQQLVKNLTGHDETTVDRKLREIFLALDLERHADKKTILECYLNIINLAEGCRGVGAAAEYYFSKEVRDLTLSECATIAAITQNPARYDPLIHPEAAIMRRNLILSEMASQGYITRLECDDAVASDLDLVSPETEKKQHEGREDHVMSWYTDMVIEDVIQDLCDRLGYTRGTASDLVYTGGLSIETAMDVTMQAIVESYYRELSHFPVGDNGRPQSSFILVDPVTGDILAVAGAVGSKAANRIQNYATDTRRSAGSAIKPLSLYAPAIEEKHVGWTTIFDDEPIEEHDGISWPRNADGFYRGHVTLEESVAESLNTVAVRLLEMIGEETSFSYLREHLGMENLRAPTEGGAHDMTISSLALGQQSYGVTSRELTAAYTVFYNGNFHPAVSYHRVWDHDGKLLLENSRENETNVFSSETAQLMTRLLGTVTDHGTAAPYLTHMPTLGIETAGKTGTTQNNCDRRFVGFTPRLLAGVWMGYDYPAALAGIAGNPCVRIWDEIMAECERNYRGAVSADSFYTPDLTEEEYCTLSGEKTNEYCPDDTRSHGYFIRGTEPQERCLAHDEPPIRVIPVDPIDPERIPLFPDDLIPHETSPEKRHQDSWFSRWFSRFAGHSSVA